jgi:hypothetical protein
LERTPLAVLLGDLHAAGIRLRLGGDRIAASPRSALTPTLRDRLRGFREEVLDALREDGERLLPMFAYGPGEIGSPVNFYAKDGESS